MSVTCTAVAPCPLFPPRLRWNLEDSRSQTARDADRVLVTQILTRIRLTEQSDGLRVTCNASYPVGHTLENATQEKILNVSCEGSCCCCCCYVPPAEHLLQALRFVSRVPRCSQRHPSVRQPGGFAVRRHLGQSQLLQQSQASRQQLHLVLEQPGWRRRQESGLARTELHFHPDPRGRVPVRGQEPHRTGISGDPPDS